jgi:hypothetical protein
MQEMHIQQHTAILDLSKKADPYSPRIYAPDFPNPVVGILVDTKRQWFAAVGIFSNKTKKQEPTSEASNPWASLIRKWWTWWRFWRFGRLRR